jgi:hypothetical protein
MFGAMNWLDTETKEMLQKRHELKLAPSKAAEFALVLLQKGPDDKRLIQAISRINNCGDSEASGLANSPMPVTINPGLTEAEALYGQFELICCDAIAVFVRSEVLLEQRERGYLKSVFSKVLVSPEFRPTRIEVLKVPTNESGQKFVEQFFGGVLPCQGSNTSQLSVWVPFKKARIMNHWAGRVGAEVRCEAIQDLDSEADGL